MVLMVRYSVGPQRILGVSSGLATKFIDYVAFNSSVEAEDFSDYTNYFSFLEQHTQHPHTYAQVEQAKGVSASVVREVRGHQ
jgi:hypothetical protein